jgi:Ni/Co efflux regulator RcnB
MYHGHEFAARHGDPYRWPHGYGYHRYGIGYRLPRAFWAREYYFYDYAAFGLDAPGPGLQWVRYGPDLLLISLATGAIVQTVYGAYY